jgi:hypothetical protein
VIDTAALIVSSYVGFVFLFLVLVLIGRRFPNRMARFGDMLNHVMRHRITRFALFMVWWWLGWHFLVGIPEL